MKTFIEYLIGFVVVFGLFAFVALVVALVVGTAVMDYERSKKR